MLYLVIPNERHEAGWRAFVSELKEKSERIVPYSARIGDGSYKNFLEITEDMRHSERVPQGFVSADTYFLVDETEVIVYGVVNIRHRLSEHLVNYGGHIGYGVAPSHRRKGYATLMLSLALEKCRKLEVTRVLVTCDKGNIGSARVIQKNGGILEDERVEADGNIVERYWISL